MVQAVFEALAILFSQSISPEIWQAALCSCTLLFWRLRVHRRARLEQAAFSRQLIAGAGHNLPSPYEGEGGRRPDEGGGIFHERKKRFQTRRFHPHPALSLKGEGV